MTDIQALIDKVERYCAATGLTPSTVCGWATNNARLIKRLENAKKRLEKYDKDITAYIAANPRNGSDA